MSKAPLDVAAVQAHLAAARGRDYWRSLEELAETDDFQEFLHREFPRQAAEWSPTFSRRRFLQLMGASLALGGLAACTGRPPSQIVAAARGTADGATGKPLFYATAMAVGGYATGLLAQSLQGRPTRLEGNPDHPASLGGSDALAQASILTLYDPDRAQQVTHQGEASTWEAFGAALRPQLAAQQRRGGAGLRILTETVTSPTLFGQLQTLRAAFPAATWHQYEPVNRDAVYAGTRLAFGQPLEPIYRLDQAAVIICLDADLFGTAPGRVRYARDFAAARRVDQPGQPMANRLYVVECAPTITGAAADHRLPLRAGQVATFARALARELGLPVAEGPVDPEQPADWVGVLARDLQAHPGAGLLVVGDHQPPDLHALVHAVNARLGSIGSTLYYGDPVAAEPIDQAASLQALAAAMAGGEVELLLILGGNPLQSAPPELDFGAALGRVPLRVHLGLYRDESAALCHWQLPESHFLEAWSDTRAYDGTVTIQQPLIEPLYASRSAHELLSLLLDGEGRSDHEIVKGYWAQQHGPQGFDAFWRRSLHDGVVADTAHAPREVTLQIDFGRDLAALPAPGGGLEVNFRPDPTIWDGRFANNGWLQELPKPLTKLTWENAALISPLTAAELGLANGDRVELTVGAAAVEAPVWLLPGHAAGAVTLHLGYGRTHAGRVGDGAGCDAYRLRSTAAPWFGPGLSLRKVGSGYALASTQHHSSMEGRHLVRVGTVADYADNPDFVQELNPHGQAVSLYPGFEYTEHAWGMTIDLTACIGCNACMVACQAENNIPVVGKEQVVKGREMHWIRLDRYFGGDLANPEIHHQPVTCMHCENAPCEVVCPVAATVHDHEGLNLMVYNRCVGTRYCSNNCPYKVRRFNFLQYADLETESLKLQRNPEVTVRSRGVMEKCTYCVQRISAARIDAKLEGRSLRDGDVVTACQAVCPTQAIVFGDLNDPQSQVSQRRHSPLSYGLLTELNTHPRTTYLARLRNPNPELSGEER